MRSACLFVACVLVVLASCGNDDSTGPSQTLQGTWDLVGYMDHGVSGTTTGTATFRADGTFVIQGTVTYPGEPADPLDVSGDYEVAGMFVTLTTQDDTGTWSSVFTGDQVVLSLIGSDPPTKITLKRQN